METRAHYVAVGAFVLILIFAAFAAVLWLGRAEVGRDLETYYIFFRGSVSGLDRGAVVQYNGIPVGHVTDIRVDKDNLEQIQVTVKIDRNLVDIKTDARAYLESNFVSGVSTIQIRGGTQEAPILEPKPGHRYAVIKPGRSELETVKSSLPELLGQLKQITQNLNQLLNAKNRKAIGESLQNLQTATATVAAHSQEVGAVLDNTNASVVELNLLLHHFDQSFSGKGGLKDQIAQLIKNYGQAATNLTAASRQLQLMVAENRPGVRDFVQATLPNVDELVGDSRQLAQNLNRLTEELQRDPTRLLFGDRRQGYQPR